MKKALQSQEEVFVRIRNGQIDFWDFDIEEIVEAINLDQQRETEIVMPENEVLLELQDWIVRYFDEGITDQFLDDLNHAMGNVPYAKKVLPLDLLESDTGYPRHIYIAALDLVSSPKAYAADEFAKILTSGMLKRVKKCKMDGCGSLFVGPPQAKWCSKTCGSKYRVREKRKKDSAR